jgi:cytochrome c-type protein NapC
VPAHPASVSRLTPVAASVADWAISLALILAILIIACIIGSRLLYRGGDSYEGGALWFHLVSLGILPLGLFVFGTFATLEHAKEAEFCAGCHRTMATYFKDMQDPRSESLAALHYQDRFAPRTECYSCHANYGLHGNVKAKMRGLQDLYTYVTRQYKFPLTPHEAFDNHLCLKCHDGARRFLAVPIHVSDAGTPGELRTEPRGCIQCHGPAHGVRKRRLPSRTGSTS